MLGIENNAIVAKPLAGNQSCAAEIVPGLWIGSLAAVRLVAGCSPSGSGSVQKLDTDGCLVEPLGPSQPLVMHWTIVSVIDSDRLIRLCDMFLAQRNANSNDISVITRQEMWKIPDKPNAKFVSQRLIQILQVIDEGLSCSSTTISTTAADANATDSLLHHNSVNENSIGSGMGDTTIRKACLVHCAKGISRSAAVCAAWYMTRKHAALEEALAVIRRARPQAQPILGFLAELRAIQQSHGNIDKAMERLNRDGTANRTSDEPNKLLG
jgi:Dual specificity phosphatase, catalytic domain